VLEYWRVAGIPKKWREWRPGRPAYRFLEGPPTTNGFPHVGHLRGRTFKDVVLKFYRLKGFNVWAQGGWDMQGLPVELEVEKKLGLTTKKDIEKVGYEKFARECNELVNYYLGIWQYLGTERLGLWLDLENAYETRREYYIEHVWAFLKEMFSRGLLFEDYRVLWFCPRCETSLSDAEVSLGYEEREDPSIYVKFRVVDRPNAYLVIWTTTPWTLVDNEAVAVNPDLEYALVEVRRGEDVEYWYLAKDLVDPLAKKFGIGEYRVVEVVRGRDMSNLRYLHPLADEVPDRRSRTYPVVQADFVTLEQGTGLVHMAPAHGPEDFEIAKRYGLPITNSLEINGVFNERAGKYSGKRVADVEREVVEDLKRKGALVYAEVIRHEYPHCWRCGTKLLLIADRQWFIRVGDFRDKLVEELKKVDVVPEKLRDRFDNFVANARDWNISRSRVWGTPLPIWRCKRTGKVMVVGSIEELKSLAKRLPPVPDFWLVHRPWIDVVEISTEDCDEWVREPYVGDVWMDSGVAWIAGVNGLRNRELFDVLYPYDLVTEGLDQTRGWFYTLLVTSVLWLGRAPYKRVLIQGLVLDKYGQKMSKSKGNVVWGEEVFGKFGSDPFRLYVLTKAAPWEDLAFDLNELKNVVSTLNILWNVVIFADTYMGLDKFNPLDHNLDKLMPYALPEDRWILSEFYSLVRRVEEYMERLELHHAARSLVDFVVEKLSHRYIRLLRRRVWSEEPRPDKYAAYAVLFHVLKGVLIMLSPMVPFITEYLYQAFVRKYDVGAPQSVHLEEWPRVRVEYVDKSLEDKFERIFSLFSIAAELRNKAGLKLRWPIREVVVVGAEEVKEYGGILAYLVNSKDVKFARSLEECKSDYLSHSEEGITVCIPSKLDEDLLYEALAREIVRRIQVMRNKLNLHVDERIDVVIETEDEEVKKALGRMYSYIAGEVRARSLSMGKAEGDLVLDWDVDGRRIRIGVRRTTS